MAPRPISLFERPKVPPELTAGLDEAGRGCLAGPVVAASVILPAEFHLPGLADSKKIPASRREELAAAIKSQALCWGIGIVWPRRIEKINILQASLEAMAKAASSMAILPRLLLVDGNRTIDRPILACVWPDSLPFQQAIVHGDALLPIISAASILAKTYRDALMVKLDQRWPNYGFARHKGYGTAAHYAALGKDGPCAMHRATFRGVKPKDTPC